MVLYVVVVFFMFSCVLHVTCHSDTSGSKGNSRACIPGVSIPDNLTIKSGETDTFNGLVCNIFVVFYTVSLTVY